MATTSEFSPDGSKNDGKQSTGNDSCSQMGVNSLGGDAKEIEGANDAQLLKFGHELRDIHGHPISEENRQRYENSVRTAGLARWRYNEHGEIIGAIISYPLADKPTEIVV